MNSTAAKAAIAIAFLLSPLVGMRVHPNAYEGGYSRDEYEVEKRNSSAIAQILGEFRTDMADLMFMKTERYLDSGVGYAPHLDMDEAAKSGTIQSKGTEMAAPSLSFIGDIEEHQAEVAHAAEEGHDHAHEEESAQTLIRTAETDFRSFIGDLEREVKPWRPPSDPHNHTDGTELLPWFRLLTITDPHNIRGYMVGSWWLFRGAGGDKKGEALAFVDEGIANNPKAYQLHLMRGHILKEAEDFADAMKSYRAAADFAVEQRPDDGTETPSWTNYKEDDARAATRLAVLLEKEYGSYPEAIRMAERYLTEFKDGDAVLTRQINEMKSAPE